MHILVTGANGFVGSNLIPALLDEHWAVTVLVRDKSKINTRQWASQIQIIEAALPTTAADKNVCHGAQVVIHLAALAHTGASKAALQLTNLDSALILAQQARSAGVKKFIFISSSKARYPAHSHYASYKAAAETQLLALNDKSTFEVICLRPALIYGANMQGNLKSLLTVLALPLLPIFIRSSNMLGMISVRDVSKAILLAVKCEHMHGQIWELGDGQAYTFDLIVAHVRTHLGYKMPLFNLPCNVVKILVGVSTWLQPLVKTSLTIGTYKALFEEHYSVDVRFNELTHFQPEENFYQVLPSLLASFKS